MLVVQTSQTGHHTNAETHSIADEAAAWLAHPSDDRVLVVA